MTCSWKANWPETRDAFVRWWRQESLILGTQSVQREGDPHEEVDNPPDKAALADTYTDSDWRARRNHSSLAHRDYPADALPISDLDIGPGSLALMLGSEPGFSPSTVWFEPYDGPGGAPERPGRLAFDPQNAWCRVHEESLRRAAELGRGRYFAGCPDLVENIDIVSALRGPERMLLDLIEHPDWVLEKVDEINEAWFAAYDRIYDIIRDDEGGAAYRAFALWGPGKTAKVQCDACAMFSPEMFDRFVLPALTAQCEWLDYSMYHLDGHQCIIHLDSLLSIESLDAVEWTPDPRVPSGGSPDWYDMYRQILAAGKSVQAIGVSPEEVIPLLDAVGGAGMYIVLRSADRETIARLVRKVEPYR